MENILKELAAIDFIAIGTKVVGALLLLLIGLWIIKVVLRALKSVMKKRNLDESLQGFLASLIGWGLRIFLFITVAGQLGVETTSFAAIIAAAGLAVGLALQGSLSNFAGGALIMIFKPFKIGDYISAQGEQGTVKKIEIFTTTLNTVDNKEIILPNGALSNGNITNFSSEEKRRVDLTFGVSYDAGIKQTKEVLASVVNNHPLILKEPAPAIVMTELAESSVNYAVRSWVKSSDYWAVYSSVLEQTKEALDKANIEIPYPHSVEIQREG
ncbi:MAG: mechanosensitive ion channel [Capnocytophaga sp.]|nr:mechanosensitive ion channel [Capnocytophaga sp.]